MKKSKQRKKNVERVFCSNVARLFKSDTNSFEKYQYKMAKMRIASAFNTFSDIIRNNDITSFYFRPESSSIAFFKTDKGIIKITYHNHGGLKKLSFVKPTLLFEEVSYKKAKENNTENFQLVKWISDNK